MKLNSILFFIIFFLGCSKNYSINNNFLLLTKKDSAEKIYYQFIAKGGERHLSLIDWGEESIPVSSKSCHHGGEIVPPLKGYISGSFDDKNIYLKISWRDLTKDNKVPIWKGNQLIDGKDDGISIIFSKSMGFNCALTCHMTNWEIEKGRFVSDYKMYNELEDNPIILIRPGKSKGKAIGGILTKEGKKNLKGYEFFVFNSKKATGRDSSFYLYQIIGEDDNPIFSNRELFILNDDNFYLDGKMQYKVNEWNAEITIPLDFLGLKEIKKGDKIYMSLAIFDGTFVNHSITDTFYAVFN